MTLFGDLIMFLKRTRRRSPQVQILLDLHRLKARNKGDLKIKSSHLSSVTSYHTPSYTHLSIRIQDLHD
uniref:Uncharacterized protein n=1 Tax=Aegilops tauschii subsp. strangulata TaxID=200361 RepID=A0A453QGN5_AEGTS